MFRHAMAVELVISEIAAAVPLFAAVPQDQSFIRAAIRMNGCRNDPGPRDDGNDR